MCPYAGKTHAAIQGAVHHIHRPFAHHGPGTLFPCRHRRGHARQRAGGIGFTGIIQNHFRYDGANRRGRLLPRYHLRRQGTSGIRGVSPDALRRQNFSGFRLHQRCAGTLLCGAKHRDPHPPEIRGSAKDCADRPRAQRQEIRSADAADEGHGKTGQVQGLRRTDQHLRLQRGAGGQIHGSAQLLYQRDRHDSAGQHIDATGKRAEIF